MYTDIYCKEMDLTDTIQALVHEKLGQLDQLLQNYPADSIVSKVTLSRMPMTDERYDVRVILEVAGNVLYARSSGAPLDSALVQAVAELEPQIQHLQSRRRNESHWKRNRRPPETIRRTVPVNDDQLPKISEEVEHRTEEQRSSGRRHRRAA